MLAYNVDLADISHLFADNMMFFVIWFKIWKIRRGDPDGPEGRSGGRSGAPRARRDHHPWFFKF